MSHAEKRKSVSGLIIKDLFALNERVYLQMYILYCITVEKQHT